VEWEILPNIYILVLLVCFFLPFHLVSGSGRYRFLTTLKRISIGGIAEAQDGKFGDILLADALTSYAKVLGDFYISFCMFFSRSRSSTGRPDRSCGGTLIVPLILAIPSLIRLRQCLIEYGRSHRASRKLDGFGKGQAGTHLANALKYSTAFPVIILSAIQRSHDPSTSSISDVTLFRIWYVTCCYFIYI
jgi:EXS family